MGSLAGVGRVEHAKKYKPSITNEGYHPGNNPAVAWILTSKAAHGAHATPRCGI